MKIRAVLKKIKGKYNIKIPCCHVDLLYDLTSEITEKITNSQYILINEGQFFDDLYNWVVENLNKSLNYALLFVLYTPDKEKANKRIKKFSKTKIHDSASHIEII